MPESEDFKTSASIPNKTTVFFEQTRSRTAFLWLLSAYLVGGVMVAKSNGFRQRAEAGLASALLLESVMAGWMYYKLRGDGDILASLIGTPVKFNTNRIYVLCALPTIAFTTSGEFLFFLLFARYNRLPPAWVSAFLSRSFWNFHSIPPTAIIIAIVTAVTLTPLIEELFFRGMVLRRFASKWGIRRSIFVTAFLFGCFHPDPVSTFVFSIVMSLLYLRTGSLYITMACHCLNNTVGVIINLVLFNWISGYTALSLTPIASLCFALSAFFLLLITLRLWNEVMGNAGLLAFETQP
jgi:membrane protease YdiL (CAAX protease family)